MTNPKIGNKIQTIIRSVGSHGEGVGDCQGYTVFVEDALPGEVVEAVIFESKKRYARALLNRLLQPSPHRVQPICPLSGTCGGCQLMHLSYDQQLEVKRQRVLDSLQRIGKLSSVEVAPCLPSPSPLYYRNKIQCPIRNTQEGISIGLYARSSHDLIEVERCFIHCSLGEEVYEKARALIKQSGIKAYDPATGTGELRHILVRSAIHAKEVLVLLVTHRKISKSLLKLAHEIMDACPYVKGVVHNLNTAQTNVILGAEYETLVGCGHIHETLCGLTFKVSPASFFQVNTLQAEKLYLKALEWAGLAGNEVVLDAFCGVGTLTLLFAKRAAKVIGIECVPEAIQDAKYNAELNQVNNASFICGKVEEAIHKLPDIDIILLNPPRKGCEPEALQGIIQIKPRTVLYISCDPATLARDLAILCSSGYAVDRVQPFDMFPQTVHVETLVKLSLNG